MVNIYLFIELLGSANAMATLDTLKALELENCQFANVVRLSDEKLVAQLDCEDAPDGDKAILNTSPGSTVWCRPTSSPSFARGSRCPNARPPSCPQRGRRPVAAL
jgi:hypothetical protein